MNFKSVAIFSLLNFGTSSPFFGADELWENFQSKLNNFVHENGDQGFSLPIVKSRPDWNEVEEVLMGNKEVSELGCNN